MKYFPPPGRPVCAPGALLARTQSRTATPKETRSMWFISPRKTRPVKPVRHPLSHRPQLEMLEDRCLLSAGQLDTTFGSGGLVTTNFAKKSGDYSSAVAVQTDGKIIVAGEGAGLIKNQGGWYFELARYNPNGTLDTSFGSGGKVWTQFSSSNTFDFAFVL